MPVTQDSRTEEQRNSTIGFVVATDSFMSGWGSAPDRSLYAVAFTTGKQREIVERHMQNRNDFKRVRVVYGKDYKPRFNDGDHLSIPEINESLPIYKEINNG
tara:strand:- start:181 stop:486 length:306 start_codon:yes stop_codon:yes gene_type:complete